MQRLTKREIFHLCAVGAAASLASRIGELFTFESEPFQVEIKGKRRWLSELITEPNRVHAQYAYYPYQYQNPYAYYGQYQMWAAGQWQQQLYQAHMQRLIQQYTWAQTYATPMNSYMRQYSNSYSLSEPFAMDSIESLYSYGNGNPDADDIVLGINRRGKAILVRGKPVRMMSAIADIADHEDWDDEEKEESSGPQSSTRSWDVSEGGRQITGKGYTTANGEAFVSLRKLRDKDTNELGSIVIFDTSKGRERRLVEV